jgi:hypothetical protein
MRGQRGYAESILCVPILQYYVIGRAAGGCSSQLVNIYPLLFYPAWPQAGFNFRFILP